MAERSPQKNGACEPRSDVASNAPIAPESRLKSVEFGEVKVTVKVSDKLAAEACAHGVSVEVYVQEILARQAFETADEQHLQSVRAAIDRILELRKGNKLAGLRKKDLIREGHKF